MTQKLIVAKFGGTSVADFNAMSHSADIIINNSNIRLVVLSASARITNILVSLSEGKDKSNRLYLINKISNIQNSIIYKIKENNSLKILINNMIGSIEILAEKAYRINSESLKDEIVSYGELMSSIIFVNILRERRMNVEWFDVRNVMKTNDNFGCAQPDINTLSNLVNKYLKPLIIHKIVVTQGFIGSEIQGRTTTLGRGGSDYTAALLGEALRATRIDIWTDVSGIYTTDPHLVATAKRIDEITFKEAAEMAIFGAKVLHPSTLLPAARSNIPVFVSSSKNPEKGGTYVCNKTDTTPLFRALALRRRQTLLNLRSLNIFHQLDFLARITNTLSNHGIYIDLLTSSEVNVAITFNDSYQSRGINIINNKLLCELSSFCHVNIEDNLSLIAIIGNNLSKANGICKMIFGMLEPFNLRMIYYGISNYNICFIVSNIDSENIIRILHHNLFE
ncbi:lysine-sensitive aspartokinase 3 [Candidatus Pantoea edessiphila]|uniref:Aspartokinase n=1 Tax=Candidatus Pantoea edessiphila TaxID=2044610 RepID=A0A2P5T1V2_9GAMM|nr:lysine-sensitive aspartokinase 3 [Candidatus Pantoea edessiphila]PPI88579.1 lysine-sensitive aspartokinase 3 [Candidatus Pantoea edessiphila]